MHHLKRQSRYIWITDSFHKLYQLNSHLKLVRQLTFDWECFFRYPAYQQQLHHRSPYLLWTQPGRTTETQCRGKSRREVACERKIWQDDDRWQLRPVKKNSLTVSLDRRRWLMLRRADKVKVLLFYFFLSLFCLLLFARSSERFLLNEKLIFLRWSRAAFQAWLWDSEEDRHDVNELTSRLDPARESSAAPSSSDVATLQARKLFSLLN